jgi:hypothetical protein
VEMVAQDQGLDDGLTSLFGEVNDTMIAIQATVHAIWPPILWTPWMPGQA